MGRVVVTGAAGFIGRHTVKELDRRGYSVDALDIAESRFEEPKRINYVNCDVTEDLSNNIEKGDKILHLAAIARFDSAETDPNLALKVNVLGTLNIIQACIKKEAERLVYSSTGSVYPKNPQLPITEDTERRPTSMYGLTKMMAEDLIFLYGDKLPYIILRYGYVYGKGKDWGAVGAFLKLLNEGKAPTIYGGRQMNDFIYVKDIVEANILALETPFTNKVYNIGTGKPTSIHEVCQICLKAIRTDIKPIVKPPRPFDFSDFVYDTTKAEKLLGFKAKWTLEEGIVDSLKD